MISKLCVPIVRPRSLSLLGNKSSIRVKALPMSPGVVLHAAGPTKNSVPAVAATATVHGIKSFASPYQWGA